MEKGIATHSSILSWSVPWTEEPSRLPWGHKETYFFSHSASDEEFLGSLFTWALIPFVRTPPSLSIPKDLHLLTLSLWGWGFNIGIFRGRE